MVSTAYREQCRVMVVTEARQTEDGSAHRMVIAARDRSRNGDDLNLRGISFKNYRKNPVVLWAHDSYQGIPIAKTVKIGQAVRRRYSSVGCLGCPVPQSCQVSLGYARPALHYLQRGQGHVGLDHVDAEDVPELVRVAGPGFPSRCPTPSR